MGWQDSPVAEETPKWKTSPTVEKQKNLGAIPYLARATATIAGAPTDIIRGAINLVGIELPDSVDRLLQGRRSWEDWQQSLGTKLPPEGRPPQTIPEHIGARTGEALGLLIPSVGVLQKISTGPRLVNQVANTVYQAMIKHPYITVVSEMTAAGGAATAAGLAEEMFPDSPMARGLMEIGGGFAGGMAPGIPQLIPSALGIRFGRKILRKISVPFTKKGAEYRAGEHVKGLTVDPAEASKRIAEETIGDLPPAVQAGESRLVELYKGFMALDPVAESDAIERMAIAATKLEKEMRKFGYGSPELLTEITKKRVVALELGMDKRILEATQRAQKKLDALTPARRQSQESRIVRAELEKVREAERLKVEALWGKVQKSTPVDFTETRKTYKVLWDDTAVAQREDFPKILKTSPIIKGKKKIATTIREMQGLRAKLLETARIARRDGKGNKARIADRMADAILEDIGIVADVGTTPESEVIRVALAGTRKFKQRFESGTVGKIFGYSKTGEPAIDPDLTLDVSIGRMGRVGAVDVEKVAITPEGRAATSRYITRSFTDYSFDRNKGVIDPGKVKKWMSNNEEILDQFPELRKQMSDASQAQELAVRTNEIMTKRKAALKDPRISASARYLNQAGLEAEIEMIMNPRTPPKMVSQVLLQARKDPTGNTLEGIKSGVVDSVFDKALKGDYNDLGEQVLSGKAILDYMKRHSKTLVKMFTPTELKRMRMVGNELSKIESFNRARAADTDIQMKDRASNAFRTFMGVAGAKAGRMLNTGTIQAPGIMSNRFKMFASHLNMDRANQLVKDAIISDDPRLLQALLAPMDKPSTTLGKRSLRMLDKRINAWLAGTGKRVMDDIINEMESDD